MFPHKKRPLTAALFLFQQLDGTQQRHFLFLSVDGGNAADHGTDKAKNTPQPANAGNHAEKARQSNDQCLIQMELGTFPITGIQRDQQSDPGDICHDPGRFGIQHNVILS